MLVQNSIYRNTYLTDGVNKDFYFSFPILESSQVLVQTSPLTDTSVPTTVDPGLYTVIGVGLATGGHVSFATAPAAGARLALTLNIPITQLYQYAELDSFPAKSHENALAKLTLICQQLNEQLERSVKVPTTSSESPEDVVASIYASRDAAAASANEASAQATAAEGSATAAANSASTAAQAVETATAEAVADATAQANRAESEANAAAQSAMDAAAAVPENLKVRVEAIEGKTAPATTTSRGIGRVATLADMALDAVIENGPAFLAAGQNYILPLSWIPGLFVGKIDLLPFAPADLATYCPGWYFCNGDQYTLSSAVGKALKALPTSFKTAWGIVVSGSNISVPKLFYSDGRGYFLRAVNGTTRLVGGVEIDDLKSHAHITQPARKGGGTYIGGGGGGSTVNLGGEDGYTTNTGGGETRPINVGMTPAIFLDV